MPESRSLGDTGMSSIEPISLPANDRGRHHHRQGKAEFFCSSSTDAEQERSGNRGAGSGEPSEREAEPCTAPINVALYPLTVGSLDFRAKSAGTFSA